MHTNSCNPKTISPAFKPCLQKFEFVPEWADDFLALFPHRGSYLWAEHPDPGERPQWKTEERHPLSDRLILQGAYLYGVRFGKQTNYLMLDIDAKSPYHPEHDPLAIPRILEALEPLGLCSFVAVSSSYSDGIHLYFPFVMAQTSWKIAQAAVVLLESKGLKAKRGQLELFPNARRMSGADYNGHRLPLQAGSYLLNEDFQSIFSTQQTFVQRWRAAQDHNDVREHQIDHTLKQFERKAFKKLGVSAQKFLNDLNAEIEPGWTGYSQTNRILGAIARREYIFHHAIYGGPFLKGLDLQFRIYEVAMSLPGYGQWCRHHHDLHYLALEWARAVEGSNYYPYGGDVVLEPEPEESLPTWNQQQAIAARERIRAAVSQLLETGTMPANARDRNIALRQFGISSKTLYKNRDLWHPEVRRESPEPLPEGMIYPVMDDQAEVRSPEPLPEGVIYPIPTISLSPCTKGAPPEQPFVSTERKAVGGAGGFSTDDEAPDSPPLEGAAAVKALIDRLTQQNQHQRSLPPPDEVTPDEQYFQQLEVALWRV